MTASALVISSQRLIRWRGPADSVKLVTDGNSITAGGQNGAESVGGVPGYLSRNVEPFASQSYAGCAIGGQTTDQMISSTSDIAAAFDASKVCVLFAQEITNQANGVTTAEDCVQKLINYVTARRSAHDWAAVVLATAPPAWLGDNYSQGDVDAWNSKVDDANMLLRARYREVADQLIETRYTGGPFEPARWPDYQRSRFFDSTSVGGYSNTSLFTDETANHIRIHYTVECIEALAPIFAAALLRTRAR